MKKIGVYLIALLGVLFSLACFADATAVGGAASSVLTSGVLSISALISDIGVVVTSFGGLSWVAKIAGIVLILVGLTKVSADGKVPLLSSIWPAFGSYNTYVAPVLGLILGILSLGLTGTLSLAGVLAYMGSGAGAVLLNELITPILALPGISSVWTTVLTVIQQILAGNQVNTGK